MSDVDDELLALVGGGSSSSRASSPAGRSSRHKRRRSPAGGSGAMSSAERRRARRSSDDDDDEDDDDDIGSVNPFPLEGIYKDDADRERLLEMPELEREDELARRRDLISQRRQKEELAAMVRSQQMAGKKPSKPAKKQRRLKQAGAAKKASSRRTRADEDEDADDFAESDEDEEAEEDDEESDFEVSRRKGARANQRAQLDKLKKRRAKGRGADASSESADESSGYSEGEMAELTRRKDARVTQMRGRTTAKKEEVKPSREEERIRSGAKKELPTLDQVNAARVRRDHFTRLVHRPDWMQRLTGKFARVMMNLSEGRGSKPQNGYRLVLLGNGHAGDRYYELGDQYTNAYFTVYYGESKFRDVPLNIISSSAILPDEYDRWRDRLDSANDKARRHVPSKELTLDRAEDFDAFISKPFTEKDINDMIAAKRQARAAFDEQRNKKRQQQTQSQQAYRQQHAPATHNGANGTGTTNGVAGASDGIVNEHTLAEMNERHRRADRERIAEAERRSLQARRALASQQASRPGSQPSSQPVTAPASPRVKVNGHHAPAGEKRKLPHIPGLSEWYIEALLDIELDLGEGF